jgi:hypothetical protein
MKTGIIGLPQVGKTSLFRILTGARVEGRSTPNQAHIGIAKVPDARVLKLAELFKPKKNTFATIEYVDVGGLQKDREKNSASLVPLREADALAQVVRLFENPAVPHEGGSLDALRDIESVEIELMLYDLEQASKRVERLEKDLKKKKETILETELALLTRCRLALESEKPLRELEFKPEELKMLSSFEFLTRKPMLYVLNLSDDEAADIDRDRKTSSGKIGEQAAHGRGAFLRKNRGGTGGIARSGSQGNDECVRPEGIRPRPADSGELPAARADFISDGGRTGVPRVDHPSRDERAGSSRRDSQRHRARIHQGRSGELGKSGEGRKFCGRAREGAGEAGRKRVHRAGWRCDFVPAFWLRHWRVISDERREKAVRPIRRVGAGFVAAHFSAPSVAGLRAMAV